MGLPNGKEVASRVVKITPGTVFDISSPSIKTIKLLVEFHQGLQVLMSDFFFECLHRQRAHIPHSQSDKP